MTRRAHWRAPRLAPRGPGRSVAPLAADRARPPNADRDPSPGSVDRTSLDVRATYDTARPAVVRLRARSWSTRRRPITNTSGGPIDRLEFNTAVARLGGLGSARSRSTAVTSAAKVERPDDHRAARRRSCPIGGDDRRSASPTPRPCGRPCRGSSWLFTKANGIVNAYRWLPWVSRATPFDRPNHGDPFVTPTSPHVRVTVNDRPQARHRDDRRPGLAAARTA